ncbi:MAG: VOC family protein [Saprospiraceae bacterium]
MNRKIFLKNLLGGATLLTASTFISMDGFSTIVNALSHGNEKNDNSSEFANYGAIHLNITNLEKSSRFWTKIVGMKRRNFSKDMAEFGTVDKTLVVLHQTAKTKFKKGYSGLYHFAIHAPNVAEFASMINRLNIHKYSYAPIDHTASKSIYLDDPDGINIEFTLETPERLKRVITTDGIKMEGTDGVMRSASERLDVAEILKSLADTDGNKIISNDSYIGHVHLYANNVQNSNQFYKKIGFIESNYLPEYLFADLGAGGNYEHRIVMNSWHGQNKPLAPKDSAGLRYFQINYKKAEKLSQAIAKVSDYEEKDGGFWITDPTGNKIFMTNNV